MSKTSLSDLPSCNRLGCDCGDRRAIFCRIVGEAIDAALKGEERRDILILCAESEWFGPPQEDEQPENPNPAPSVDTLLRPYKESAT